MQYVLSGQFCVKGVMDVDGFYGYETRLELHASSCVLRVLSPRKCTGDFLKDSYSERRARYPSDHGN